MTEREEFGDTERKLSNGEKSLVQMHESDNAWKFQSVPEEEFEKWKMEKERYDEVIEYIREVDEILNLIKPFPREGDLVKRGEPPLRSDSQSSRFGLDHLETIIKLVEQLKELQENIYKSGERTCYLKDLKKLREHKKRLKKEEMEMRNRVRFRSVKTPDEYELCLANRKSSSTSEKFEPEPKERWQDKRKSICLGENRSKVSKWTKVKEAFHWEKTSAVARTFKRENSAGEKNLRREETGRSREVSPDESAHDVFCSASTPPTPPPPPQPRLSRPEELLSVRPTQDLPSSSSSDRLEEILSFSALKEENKLSEPDSPSQPLGLDDNEDVEVATRKFSCEEFGQHLTKEELATSRSAKSNKTTWGKVKDIIQTRKDSLKKKPKKRGSDEFKKRRKLSTASNPPQFSDQFEDLSSPEDKVKNAEIIPKSAYDFSDEISPSVIEEKRTKRLTPALTVTLPSTEELRSFSFDDAEKRDSAEEDKSNILSQFSCQAQYCEDKSKCGKSKLDSNQRLSRWIKVKRVFLTSANTPRPPQHLPISPTCQNKSSGFFSDLESDDLSSGEWIDEKSPLQEKQKLGYPETQPLAMALIQEDIRKSYNELQKKLSQEFDQKLKEWEVKIEAPNKQDDSYPKIKGDDGDCIPKFRKTRDSIAVPLPNLNDLSPEFKKKLNDWKKMKTSQSSSSVSSSTTKEEMQGQNIKIRIGEWQPWRSRCSGKGVAKGEQSLSEDHAKKFEERQKGWGSSRPPANRRKDDEEGFTGSANRRGSKRRDSIKKLNRISNGDGLISSASAEKDGRFIRRSQKVKDFHWVEKELQKIEREKLRLEQEKEKYLEREARLEKMKKTMRTSPTQEILVRTPEGFFRFKGISQKFTKKLYEWEKARGIAPEASTFALLEESAETGADGDGGADGTTIQRSKSTGSVPELSSSLLIQTMAHHQSSLSLNDVDELKLEEEESISLGRKGGNEEPEAIIVDVEDIEEETAILAEGPSIQSETPVYTYTSKEIDRLTESEESLYISNGFGVTITERKETNRATASAAKILGTVQDNGNMYSEVKLRLESCESKTIQEVTENVLKRQEKEHTTSVECAANMFQDGERRTASENSSKVLTTPSCGFVKPKVKDIYDFEIEKTENSEITGQEINLPLESSSPKSFYHRIRETQNTRQLTSESTESLEVSSERKSNLQNSSQAKPDPQVLKRKLKEKITLMQRLSSEAGWKYSDSNFKKPNDEADSMEGYEKTEISERTTKVSEHLRDGTSQLDECLLQKSESVSVFVPTTRKIISPVKTTEGATPSVHSYIIDDVKPETREKLKQNESNQTFLLANIQSDSQAPKPNSLVPVLRRKGETEIPLMRDIGMPPLPNSPKSFKKLSSKETAPSIRMIIAKYNQKISEHDNVEGKRTDAGSPNWRSPVFGRRTQEKIEIFRGKDEANGRVNGEVHKSASLDSMRTRMINRSSLTPPQDRQSELKGISKSNSLGVMRTRPQNHEASPDYTSNTDTLKETSPLVLRAMKIQKAKEDFLSGKVGNSSSASTTSAAENSAPAETQIRIIEPQAEIEHCLAKSVSAETITNNETSRSDCLSEKKSDARFLQKSSSKFDISSIRSKFRRLRMKKEKDPKLNAVAILCRQSLFIEVPKASESSATSKSCPSSPVMDRNKYEKSSQPPKKYYRNHCRSTRNRRSCKNWKN